MIELISWTRTNVSIDSYNESGSILIGYKFEISFILFGRIECNCEFESQDFNLDVKHYIEKQLIEDFKNASATQLEGKPSNLKTK